MKVLTANSLIDGDAVWFADDRSWSGTIDAAEIAHDEAGEARLAEIAAAAIARCEVVDVNIIDVQLVDGGIEPVRLREKIRAAGPTVRLDLGKQAELPVARAA